MKRGMCSLHELFPSELAEGGMLNIGTGALAGQRGQEWNHRGTSELLCAGDIRHGKGQVFTATGGTCGCISLKDIHFCMCP